MTPVPFLSDKLLKKSKGGEIDQSFVIMHTRPPSDTPEMFNTFCDKKDNCIKVALKP